MSAVTASHLARVDGLFTSEAVSDGHPDKLCDRISDAVLDTVLAKDPEGRVAVEVACKDHEVNIFGEVTTAAEPDFEMVVRRVLQDTGHGDGRWGLDLGSLAVRRNITRQSPEIASGVAGDAELGAGDQGIVFGFACEDTPELMPLPIALANRLMRRQREVRTGSGLGMLGPDAKSQVTIRYDHGRPIGVHTVVVSTQHAPTVPLTVLRELVVEEIIRPVLAPQSLEGVRVLVNPAGTFHVGGPVADAGLTGRKIIADTYGGFARHGGGAFSGKDPTKVDRSAAYAARNLALTLVAQGGLAACEVRLCYAIGLAEPLAIHVDGAPRETDPISGWEVEKWLAEDGAEKLTAAFRPASIIRKLGLRMPIYEQTAAFGHFGRPEFPWEQPSSLIGCWRPGAASWSFGDGSVRSRRRAGQGAVGSRAGSCASTLRSRRAPPTEGCISPGHEVPRS